MYCKPHRPTCFGYVWLWIQSHISIPKPFFCNLHTIGSHCAKYEYLPSKMKVNNNLSRVWGWDRKICLEDSRLASWGLPSDENGDREGRFFYPDLTQIIRPWAGYRPPSPPPRGNFVHYNFLKLHYIRHKIKDVSPLRVAALTHNITLYTLPRKIALNIPDNVSTMTC